MPILLNLQQRLKVTAFHVIFKYATYIFPVTTVRVFSSDYAIYEYSYISPRVVGLYINMDGTRDLVYFLLYIFILNFDACLSHSFQ
jgi:hypothetical protein